MMSLFLWSQLVVSLALLLDLLSFQLRERRRILACLALSCALNAGDGDLRELIAAVESLHDDLGSIIARYTPTIGDRDFARKVRSAIA